MRKVILRGAARAVVLTHRAPRAFAQIRAPALPVFGSRLVLAKAHAFSGRVDLGHSAHPKQLEQLRGDVRQVLPKLVRCGRQRDNSAAPGSGACLRLAPRSPRRAPPGCRHDKNGHPPSMASAFRPARAPEGCAGNYRRRRHASPPTFSRNRPPTLTRGLIQTRMLHLMPPRLTPSPSGFANSIRNDNQRGARTNWSSAAATEGPTA